MAAALAPVNTVVYGEMSQGSRMNDQLTAKDWLDQGLKALTKSGFTALKAEPLAKAIGVSRGSFYWHFADIAAFHAAILKLLARGCRRADHRQPRSRLRSRRPAGAAAASGIRH
jgi:AcrR family transcriptional regulator